MWDLEHDSAPSCSTGRLQGLSQRDASLEGGTREWDPEYSAMTKEPLAQEEAMRRNVI